MKKLEQITIIQLSCEPALHKAQSLITEGLLRQQDNYSYLKVDDDYIHLIHPLLAVFGPIDKPDYFNPTDEVGAHISVIYPEENRMLAHESLGQRHHFSVSGLIKAQYGNREYFALSVTAPSLETLRKTHHLAPNPTFKGHQIVFHITVGIRDKLII